MTELFGNETAVIEIPLFPLPNVVFFPGTLLPLHIFEPRYREMVAGSLEGDRRIGMVLMRDSSEIHSIGGMGRISNVRELDDGRFDILLSGISRFKVLEISGDEPYTRAQVKLLPDFYRELPEDESFRKDLLERLRQLIDLEGSEGEELVKLEEADFPTLINSSCSALQILPQDKQALLEIDDIRGRAEAVRSVIEHLLAQRDFVERYDHLRPDEPLFN